MYPPLAPRDALWASWLSGRSARPNAVVERLDGCEQLRRICTDEGCSQLQIIHGQMLIGAYLIIMCNAPL
jgi:hypothetical protein